jgi:ribonucleoside-diphosphate reductase alpha chain
METSNANLTPVDLNENALAVLGKRYLRKNEKGEPIEEPVDMFARVADSVARAELSFAGDPRLVDEKMARTLFEEQRGRFLDLMISRKFMPNSPT